MNRRQVLAGLAAGLTLGLFRLEPFEGEADGNAVAPETGQAPTGRTAIRNDASSARSAGSSRRALIDDSNLVTYTNDSASYSIEHPANWRITVANPRSVRITDPESPARILVRVKDGVSSVIPRETIVTMAIRRAKRRHSIDRVVRVEQREITLPGGTPGTLVKTRLHRSTTDTMLRGTFVVAHVTETVYATGIFVPERAVTPTVDRAMTTIVESLTIYDTESIGHD